MSRVIRRTREANIYFEDGKFLVTDRNLKTPRKTYRIAKIEKIALRRDPFYFALALSLPLLGFWWAFNDLLYTYERIILTSLPVGMIALTSKIGVLYVESLTLGEMAAVANMSVLRNVRAAVEDSMDDLHDGRAPDDNN